MSWSTRTFTCTTAKQPPADKARPQYGWQLRRDCATPADYEKSPGYVTARAALEHGLRVGFMHGYSDGTYDAIFHMKIAPHVRKTGHRNIHLNAASNEGQN